MMRTTTMMVAGLALLAARLAAAEADAPVQIGADLSGGIAMFSLADFKTSADDFSGLYNGGTASVGQIGYTVGVRAIAFLPMGLGASIGIVPEGGGSLTETWTHPTAKKGATSITEILKLKFTEMLVPISVHFRTTAGSVMLGGEVGLDIASGTVNVDESDNLGGAVTGDLKDSAIGFHLAGEGAVELSKNLWGFLRVAFTDVDLNNFSGTLNDNGTMKNEQLYLFRDSSGLQTLGTDTSANVASTNHTLADVPATGLRVTLGLRILFP